MKRKLNEKSLANLKRFEKGHPGMGGRPKGSISIVKVIEKMLSQEIEIKNPFTKQKEKKKIVEAIATALFAKGLSGDVSAIKELLDRIDGKVVQKTENVNLNHEDALRMLSDDEPLKNTDKLGQLETE